VKPALTADTPLSERTFLTWDQVTEYLGLSKNAIRCRMKRGSFPRTCYSTSLGELRFLRAEIDRWIASGAKDATETVTRLRLAHGSASPQRPQHATQPGQQRRSHAVDEARDGAGLAAVGFAARER
jgi:predicted DNA-binding transcriptional regulator AlpA